MNNEMKIIDLYELIANKEYDKLPRKIRVRDCIYDLEIDEEFINYKPQNGDWLLNQFLLKLNEKIEILEIPEEEKKIPVKLYLSDYEDTTGKFDYDVLLTINEIIDYLDYLKSKGE